MKAIVKRYNRFGKFISADTIDVVIPELTVYPDLKTQLDVESYSPIGPSDAELESRRWPSCF